MNFLTQTVFSAGLALCWGLLPAPSARADASPAPPGSSAKGVMFLATRGYARTSTDRNFPNLEAQTLHRHEFPYGASAGWKWVYQGFSDGTDDTIHIIKAGLWVQQTPGGPVERMRLTFNGGAESVTLEKEALQETDAIATEIQPGAVVWVTTWYRTGKPTTGLPWQTLLFTKETTPGAEDNDGTLSGEIGSMEDHTLTGGFTHTGGKYNLTALTAGAPFCSRGYRPMGAVGRPHPGFTGVEIVPFFTGDSLNVQANDFSSDETHFAMRGFNGRFCAAKYPYVIFGQGGSSSGGLFVAARSPLFTYILGDKGGQGPNLRRVTHWFNEYGINTVRLHKEAGEIAAMAWEDRRQVAAMAREYGLPYIHSTLTPCEARHTTGFKDPAWFATFVEQRQAFNNRVRSESDDAHLPGCIGFWDWCTVLETDAKAGSNAWVPEYNADGIHPRSDGHIAAVATMSDELLKKHPNPIPIPAVVPKKP